MESHIFEFALSETDLSVRYCKFGNFREDFIFAKFRENKTLAK